MKHVDEPGIDAALLADLLREAAIPISPAQLHRMTAFTSAFLTESQRVNLTAIRGTEAILRLHVVDSCAAAPEVNAAPDGELLDLGTGGGFPGVPLCILTGRHGTLLDSVRKKTEAVNRALIEAGLSDVADTAWARAEDWATGHVASYAVVTARAVAELPALVEWAAPLLRRGGVFVALKGAPTDEEVARGETAAGVVGLKEVSRRELCLPRGGERRCILAYERVSDPRLHLPRAPGEALRNPVA